jgi:hypothetical protein
MTELGYLGGDGPRGRRSAPAGGDPFDQSSSKERDSQPFTTRHEMRSVRYISTANLVLLSVIALGIVVFVVSTLVILGRIASTAESTIGSAQALLATPELKNAIKSINALVSDANVQRGITQVGAFMAQPEIANILKAANGAIENLPTVEALIAPLLSGELSTITSSLSKFLNAAGSVDPVDVLKYVRDNHLLERVVALFNLIDRLNSQQDIEKMQALLTQVDDLMQRLQKKGINIQI